MVKKTFDITFWRLRTLVSLKLYVVSRNLAYVMAFVDLVLIYAEIIVNSYSFIWENAKAVDF